MDGCQRLVACPSRREAGRLRAVRGGLQGAGGGSPTAGAKPAGGSCAGDALRCPASPTMHAPDRDGALGLRGSSKGK